VALGNECISLFVTDTPECQEQSSKLYYYSFKIFQHVNRRNLSRTWEMASELRRVLDFIYVHPIVLWAHANPSESGLLGIKRTRAGKTRQGLLRRFYKAIARFVDRN